MSSISKISIVTPSFNQGSFIEEALHSVRDQAHLLLEHIVIDGASTDTTISILKKYSEQPEWKHLKWISEPDSGQTEALNKGFRMATGEIIGWLNADDRYRPGCFEAVVDAFGSRPDIDIFYGDYTYMDENGRVYRIRREIEFSRFILRHYYPLYIPTASTFFRRRIFDAGNWLNVNYDYVMDYEFFLRLSQKSYHFQHIPELLADFRWHPASKSSSPAGPSKQREEGEQAARMYSPILRRVPQGLPLILVRASVRALAASLRYSEKLLRGYYFEQFRDPKTNA